METIPAIGIYGQGIVAIYFYKCYILYIIVISSESLDGYNIDKVYRRKKEMSISWEKCPEALLCGTILEGKYEIREILGRGGSGITYGAWDRMMHRNVAIKEYFPIMLATRLSLIKHMC